MEGIGRQFADQVRRIGPVARMSKPAQTPTNQHPESCQWQVIKYTETNFTYLNRISENGTFHHPVASLLLLGSIERSQVIECCPIY
jgi:hypothetical protein